MIWNGPVTWSSKRQLILALSTAESEYIGECNAAKEAIFLSRSITPIGVLDFELLPQLMRYDIGIHCPRQFFFRQFFRQFFVSCPHARCAHLS